MDVMHVCVCVNRSSGARAEAGTNEVFAVVGVREDGGWAQEIMGQGRQVAGLGVHLQQTSWDLVMDWTWGEAWGHWKREACSHRAQELAQPGTWVRH